MFVILGASGDLAKRKLFPALYNTLLRNELSNFAVVGAALDATSASEILQKTREHIQGTIDEAVFARLQERMEYYTLNADQPADYEKLVDRVRAAEKKHNLSGNRIIYLAVAAQYYCAITQQLATSGLAHKMGPSEKVWHRIVYEKPFGSDLQSAHEINECIAKHFDEKQIYRVDHYLTKELVGNIALVRFTNIVFEPLWNNRFIDNVQIILSEEAGIEERGAYYDRYGALKDVVQNHVMELMALIGMESPEWLTGEQIRMQRAKVLEKVKVVDALLGQYQGYRDEKFVDPQSNTETFVAAYLTINNPRWAGVPFYIKTGKCLTKKETVIHIKFKQVDCLLAKNCPSESNYLTIRVFPDAAFELHLNAKKPGRAQDVIPVAMEFCHSCIFGPVTQEAYEVIFADIMRGEHSISVRFDEIESAWKVIDAIKALKLPVYAYATKSSGPRELDQFTKKHGVRWLS